MVEGLGFGVSGLGFVVWGLGLGLAISAILGTSILNKYHP